MKSVSLNDPVNENRVLNVGKTFNSHKHRRSCSEVLKYVLDLNVESRIEKSTNLSHFLADCLLTENSIGFQLLFGSNFD